MTARANEHYFEALAKPIHPVELLEKIRTVIGCQTCGGRYVRVIRVLKGLTEWKRDERSPAIIETKFQARVDQLVGSRWLAI
jgi:hypothetical protein